MNAEIGNGKQPDDDDEVNDEVDDEAEDELDTESTVVMSTDDDDDDIADISAEINVDELLAKLDSTDGDDVGRRRAIKQRLEELREQREVEKDIDSTYNFNLDDEF